MIHPTLSILIGTLVERRLLRRSLFCLLALQTRDRPVEVLQIEDNRQMTIGNKRQQLLEHANGDYVCFVDDDDLVSNTYVDDILVALGITPGATHCSLKGILLQSNMRPRSFEHSTRYKEWATINGVYVRPPNHVNAIRRDLALQAGFTSSSWGEDREFSEKLVQLGTLTCEAVIEEPLYYYRYSVKPSPARGRRR